MNWLDIVILVLLIISAFGGLMNGLIKSILSMVGLILGVVLAGRYYINLAGILGFIPSENAAKVVAFIIIFVIILIIVTILGVILTNLVSAILLGWANRLAGAVLGVVVGAIFIAAILAIWVKYMGASGSISGSTIAPFLLERFPAVLALLPNQFDSIRNFFH